MRSRIAEYLRLMRLPGAATVAVPLLFGALSVNITAFNLLIPLFIIGILSGIYGFVFNDLIDAELDSLSSDLSKRALVKGEISKNAAKIIIIGCFCAVYALIFIFFFRNDTLFFSALVCLILADVIGIVHNTYGKNLIGTDFLLAIAHSLYLLFGALIVLQAGRPSTLTWIFFILVYCQLVFDNAILGGIKDADHDTLYNVKNIAVSSGVRVKSDQTMVITLPFQLFGLGLRLISCIIIFLPLTLNILNYELWQILLFIGSEILLILLCYRMLTVKTYDRAYLRRTILIQECIWYPTISLLLMPLIGSIPTIILILMPGLWYLFFSAAINGKILEPELI